MVGERESLQTEILHRFLRVDVLGLSAQIVDFDHPAVVQVEELYNVLLPVAVHALETLGWESHRNDAVRDVSQVQIEIPRAQSRFVC